MSKPIHRRLTRAVAVAAAVAAVAAAGLAVSTSTAAADEALAFDVALTRTDDAGYTWPHGWNYVVAVQPDPGTDVDLSVSDAAGNPVAASRYPSNATDFVVMNGLDDKDPYRGDVTRASGGGQYRVQATDRNQREFFRSTDEPGWREFQIAPGNFLSAVSLAAEGGSQQVTVTASGISGSSGEIWILRNFGGRTRAAALGGGAFSDAAPEVVTTVDSGPCDVLRPDGTCFASLVIVIITTTPSDFITPVYVKVGPYDGSAPPF